MESLLIWGDVIEAFRSVLVLALQNTYFAVVYVFLKALALGL